MSVLLEIGGLQSFYGVSQVLHGIDLGVKRGEQIALLGRNGMGKTTLLKSIMGLVADRRGRIALQWQDIVKAHPEAVARRGVTAGGPPSCRISSTVITSFLILTSAIGSQSPVQIDWHIANRGYLGLC